MKARLWIFIVVLAFIVVSFEFIAKQSTVVVDTSTPRTCQTLNLQPDDPLEWQLIRSDADMEECLLHFARTLETEDKLAKWLSNQGFSRVEIRSSIPGTETVHADLGNSRADLPFDPDLSLWKSWMTKDKTYAVFVTYRGEKPVEAGAGFLVK